MTYVVNISNVLNEDTGEVGVVHVEVTTEDEGRALINAIVTEEDADPADFSLVTAPDNWECINHGDAVLCTAPRLN